MAMLRRFFKFPLVVMNERSARSEEDETRKNLLLHIRFPADEGGKRKRKAEVMKP
jgi:hypothetical protein